MIPETPPFEDVPALFVVERERLLEVLTSLESEDWNSSTPCPGWSVLDLSAHLLGVDLALVAALRDGHRGSFPPSGAEGESFVSWLDDLQVDWVVGARRLSPRLVIQLLQWCGPAVVDALRSTDPRSRTSNVSWADTDPVPFWLDQLRELSERWIHRQQIREALGLPSDLRPDLLCPVFEGLRWSYPYRLSAVDCRAGDTVTVRITGEVPFTWHLVYDGDGWSFSSDPGGPEVGHLEGSSEQVWRLLTNNLRKEARSLVAIGGRPEIVEVLATTRAIVGVPKWA